MKGGHIHGIRSRQILLALFSIGCTTVIIWAWEKTSSTSILPLEDSEPHLLNVISQECNYANGKWVPSNKRPLYSGFECKDWLSDMWDCRLTQRTDFTYEGFRWKSDSCEIPEFDGSTFLKRMKNKTIALIGDSLGRQQFQSLMCMVTATGGKNIPSPDVIDIGFEYDLLKPAGAIRPNGWAYLFPASNTTILFYWSSTLCDLEPLNVSDPATSIAMHLDRPPSFLSKYLKKFDVVLLNTGHHWNRGKLNSNRWEMHVGGKPLRDRKLSMIGNAKNYTLYSVVRWLDSQLPKHPQLKVFLRTMSPRHFMNGEWNTGGSCNNTTPLAHGSRIFQNESSDYVAASAVKGTMVNLLDVTALSQLRDEGHISRYSLKPNLKIQDCLHWCLPGIPDTWNEIFAAQI